MNELQIFKSQEFGQIRTLTIDSEPWFVGKDVADILGYQNGSRDINRHVDADDKRKEMITDGKQLKETILINESGLYSLILSSKLPTAKQFKRWITAEILPSIRRTGGYIASTETMTDAEIMSKALLIAKQTIESREQRIQFLESETERMRPMEVFANATAASDTSILVGELAKLIKQNGVDMGQNRLFKWMRENGYLIKSGAQRNMPTQKSMNLGLFEIKERNVANPDGSVMIVRTPKVTGKGQIYFVNLFLKNKGQTGH